MRRFPPILVRLGTGLVIVCVTGCGAARSRAQNEGASGAHYKLGLAYLNEEPPKVQKAYVEFLQAVETDPKNADALYALGHTYAQRQEYDKAVETFQKLVVLDPNASKAHNYLGNVYEALGREDEAIVAYRHATRDLQYETPQLPHWKLGLIYFKRAQYASALSEFREAHRVEPNNVVVIHQIGETYVALGETEKARSFFEEATKVAPDNHQAYHRLAQFYLAKGLLKPAATVFRKVIELSPESREAQEAGGILSQIRE